MLHPRRTLPLSATLKNNDIFNTQMLFYSAACQNPTFPAGRD